MESNKDVLKAELEFSNGEKKEINLDGGDLVLVEADYQEISITLTPAKGIDVGSGVNEAIQTTIYGGQVGIIFDCRGRPLSLSKKPSERISELNNWSKALNEYPSLEV